MCLFVNVLCTRLKQEVKFEMFMVYNLNLRNSFCSLNNKPAYICQGKSDADLNFQ